MTALLIAIPLTLFTAWFVPWLLTPLPKWAERSPARPYFDIDGRECERVDLQLARKMTWRNALGQGLGILLSG